MRNVKDFMEKVKREKISIVGAQTFGGLPGNGYADIFFFFLILHRVVLTYIAADMLAW